MTKKNINCPVSIDNFINYMNQNIYGMNWESPFYGSSPPSGSWCRLNVTNCSPPGFMTACPSLSTRRIFVSI